MPRNVTHRLRSEQGASMSMALMLFLVCTTVASIVITAASASAGRLSQLRETDKSYYNVTSAANLIWDELKQKGNSAGSGVAAKVIRACDNEYQNWIYYIIDEEGNKITEDNPSIDAKGSSPEAIPAVTVFEEIACKVLFGVTETNGGAVASQINNAFTEAEDGDLVPNKPNYEILNDPWSYDFSISKKSSSDESIKEQFDDVTVSITGGEGSIITFAFCEESNPNTCCTITAYMNISEALHTVGESGNHIWTNKITWQPLYISMGD